MGTDSRVIEERMRRPSLHRHYAVYREGDFFVLYNHLTRRKRYYARISDVQALLDRPNECLCEEQ